MQWDKDLIVRTLENGFRYIVYDSDKREEPFNLRLIVDVGSVDDEALKGMAHIVEHMVFRTNDAYSGSIHQLMDDIGWKSGLQVNALTRQTKTQFMVRTRPDDALNLKQSVELLANLAFRASLLDTDWQVERKVILEEMRLVGSGLADRVNLLKKAVVRNGSRYVGRPPLGFQEDIRKITIPEFKS